MAVVSLFLSRFKYTTFPVILFVLYTSFQIHKARKESPNIISIFDVSSPMIIGAGILLMYYGRIAPPPSDVVPPENHTFWSWTFWAGETLVMTMFVLNTLTGRENSFLKPSLPLAIGFYVLCSLICLILRGKTWRYLTALGFDMILALLAVLVFPIMEMILEEIMNEKLKKVGNKVRQYSKAMEESYKMKLNDQVKNGNSSSSGSIRSPSKAVEYVD